MKAKKDFVIRELAGTHITSQMDAHPGEEGCERDNRMLSLMGYHLFE